VNVPTWGDLAAVLAAVEAAVDFSAAVSAAVKHGGYLQITG
jgi:hypothetical protein